MINTAQLVPLAQAHPVTERPVKAGAEDFSELMAAVPPQDGGADTAQTPRLGAEGQRPAHWHHAPHAHRQAEATPLPVLVPDLPEVLAQVVPEDADPADQHATETVAPSDAQAALPAAAAVPPQLPPLTEVAMRSALTLSLAEPAPAPPQDAISDQVPSPNDSDGTIPAQVALPGLAADPNLASATQDAPNTRSTATGTAVVLAAQTASLPAQREVAPQPVAVPVEGRPGTTAWPVTLMPPDRSATHAPSAPPAPVAETVVPVQQAAPRAPAPARTVNGHGEQSVTARSMPQPLPAQVPAAEPPRQTPLALKPPVLSDIAPDPLAPVPATMVPVASTGGTGPDVRQPALLHPPGLATEIVQLSVARPAEGSPAISQPPETLESPEIVEPQVWTGPVLRVLRPATDATPVAQDQGPHQPDAKVAPQAADDPLADTSAKVPRREGSVPQPIRPEVARPQPMSFRQMAPALVLSRFQSMLDQQAEATQARAARASTEGREVTPSVASVSADVVEVRPLQAEPQVAVKPAAPMPHPDPVPAQGVALPLWQDEPRPETRTPTPAALVGEAAAVTASPLDRAEYAVSPQPAAERVGRAQPVDLPRPPLRQTAAVPQHPILPERQTQSRSGLSAMVERSARPLGKTVQPLPSAPAHRPDGVLPTTPEGERAQADLLAKGELAGPDLGHPDLARPDPARPDPARPDSVHRSLTRGEVVRQSRAPASQDATVPDHGQAKDHTELRAAPLPPEQAPISAAPEVQSLVAASAPMQSIAQRRTDRPAPQRRVEGAAPLAQHPAQSAPQPVSLSPAVARPVLPDSRTYPDEPKPVAQRPGDPAPTLQLASGQPASLPVPLPTVAHAPSPAQPATADHPRHTLPTGFAPALAHSVVTSGHARAELILEPAELGRLRFDLVTQGDQVQVTLAAERPETLDLLRRHSEELRQEFRASGLDTGTLSFGQWGKGEQERSLPDWAGEDLPPPLEEPIFPPAAPIAARLALAGTGLDLRL